MRQRLQIGFFGLLLGAILGGVSGAIVLGLSYCLDDSSGSIMGSPRDWAFPAAILGLIYGGAVGAIIGGIIGAFRTNKLSSVIIAVIIGALAAVNRYSPFRIYAPEMIIYCGIFGVALAMGLQKQYERPDPPADTNVN
jgi:hypothetical protein